MSAWYYFTAWKTDAWLYYHVPSAYGIEFPAVTFTKGAVTFEGSPVLLFNWRSGELDAYLTGGAGGALSFGVPGASGSANMVPFKVYGASSNSSWEGSYVAGTLSGYLPFKVPAGGMTAGGYSTTGWKGFVEAAKTNDYSKFIARDPISGLPIASEYGGIGVGSPGVSGTITFGDTIVHANVFDMSSPFTFVLPNNPYLPSP